jgi:hypothetical protein
MKQTNRTSRWLSSVISGVTSKPEQLPLAFRGRLTVRFCSAEAFDAAARGDRACEGYVLGAPLED